MPFDGHIVIDAGGVADPSAGTAHRGRTRPGGPGDRLGRWCEPGGQGPLAGTLDRRGRRARGIAKPPPCAYMHKLAVGPGAGAIDIADTPENNLRRIAFAMDVQVPT